MWYWLTYILEKLRNGIALKAKSSFPNLILVLGVFDKFFKRKLISQLTPHIAL